MNMFNKLSAKSLGTETEPLIMINHVHLKVYPHVWL